MVTRASQKCFAFQVPGAVIQPEHMSFSWTFIPDFATLSLFKMASTKTGKLRLMGLCAVTLVLGIFVYVFSGVTVVSNSYVEKVTRETLWPYYASRAGGDIYKDICDRRRESIAEIAVTNKTRAAEMRIMLDKAIELDKRADDLTKQMSVLYEKAKKKVAAGQDDGDEYHQAKKLHEMRNSVEKECSSILDKIRR